MSSSWRAADARFLLSEPLTLEVVGDTHGWSDAAAATSASGSKRAALVGPRAFVSDAVDDSTDAVILLAGGRVRALRAWHWIDVLVRPGTNGPRLLVPAGHPHVAQYVFTTWAPSVDRWRQTRNALLARVVDRGVVPPGSRLSVGNRVPGPPYLIRAARDFGLPATPGWFCSLGDGDDYQRATFHVFPREAEAPEWVVKFARRPGDDGPFVSEQQALELLQLRAPRSATSVPRVLGRGESTVPASVETAAAGPALSVVLDGPGDRRTKLAIIDDAVDWIVGFGLESRGPVDEVEPERARLSAVIVAEWPAAPRDLVESLPPLGPVMAHHDLGSWNMVVTRAGIAVLDWESARYPALPLWDLLYFLTDALVALDGPADQDTKVARALSLLRGDTPESSRLFGRLRDAAVQFSVPLEAVGILATLAWMHHGTSPGRRVRRAGADPESGEAIGVGLLTRIAQPWLADPALGPSWAAFPR